MTASKAISYDHGARIAERAKQNNAWDKPATIDPAIERGAPMRETPMPEAPVREATIILPTKDNHSNHVPFAHGAITGSLLDYFGGYTEETVRGAWIDDGKVYRDESIRYTIAARATADNQTLLEEIARRACADARQICIYTRGFDGIVRMINA